MNIANVASLAEAREELHVSASQLGCYMRCPEQHLHRYIRRTPPSHRSSALAFGRAFHAGLAHFYEALQNGTAPPSAEELQEVFGTAFERQLAVGDVLFKDDGEDADSLQAKAHDMLAVFHTDGLVPDEVLGVEVPFSVSLDGHEETLVGGLDLVCRHEGRLLIVEHKTSARRKSEDDLRHDLQASVYALAAKELGLPDAEILFQVITKTKTPVVQIEAAARSTAQLSELGVVIDGVLAGVRAGVHFPVRSWMCGGCPYQHACGVR